MNREIIFNSERLFFSVWDKEDRSLANDLWGDLEVTKLIDTRGRLSVEQVMEKLDKELKNMAEYGVQYWPVFLRDTNELAGCCGLRPYDISKGIYELGVHLKKKFWGKGLAYEACSTVIEYAFDSLAIDSLFAGHNPNNLSSKRLLGKLGFAYTHKEYYPPTGLNHPSYLLRRAEYLSG